VQVRDQQAHAFSVEGSEARHRVVDSGAAEPTICVPGADVVPMPNSLNSDAANDPPQPADAAARLAGAQEAIGRKDTAAAVELLDLSALPADAPLDTQLAWADALAQANAAQPSDVLFEALLERNPRSRRVRFNYAKRLHARGLAIKAARLLDDVVEAFPEGSPPRALIERIRYLRDVLQALEGVEISEDVDCRLLAIKHAMAQYRNRDLRPLATDRIGRLTLATGSLGPGGAERQLSRLAVEFEGLRSRGEPIGGVTIDQPIEVLVRSHGPERQSDFFLAELRAANVNVAQITKMPRPEPNGLDIADKQLEALLSYLPARVNFDLHRLVDHFRKTKPDVVSIWQDGACLIMAPAAIVAGVPRIQLVMRGLPPVIRRHKFLPEYEETYRALAELPGVEFVSNSRAVAKAYAEWLDLPLERFSVIYNGVTKLPCKSDNEKLKSRWEEFLLRTPDADHTVGGVFRFDTDKRPHVWIRFAARYASKHPNARFVLVGDGRLLDEAIKLAETFEISDRILFVGRSSDVGYWMTCMDVLVLMSSFEGLPNVLIEAQYMSVPVVSTPAGGAVECFLEGVTGHLLGCAERTDLEEACEKVRPLVGRARDPNIFGPAKRDFLDPNFSVANMVEKFALSACGRLAPPPLSVPAI